MHRGNFVSASSNEIERHRRRARCWFLACLAMFVAYQPLTWLLGAETPVATASGSKPLVAGLEPQAAADYMSVPEGFHVELAAGEPLVHQPVAMCFDARGRLWVAEAYTYPIRAPEGQGLDKIVILTDHDRDGRFEDRKVFAEGLNLVSGLEVGFGGVWIGAAPYLMFIPDRNGDDVPDAQPQVLLDGFGYEDTHETLNAFIWGPDGWLYGCHGVFTHSLVGKPGTPDAQRTPMNAAVWRYHPLRHEFEVFSWGTSNPWGVDFNEQGHAFITACVIPHLWHIIQGARYERQGGQHFDPYFYEEIATIAEHRHYAGDIRDHAWWGKEPEAPADTLAAGGGHAHCGAMIYLGDNWPAKYRNEIFMNNIHGNRVNQDHLARRGSGYVGQRAPDLMLANDKWYRGINLKCAPDGSVYVIDWYDRNACHRVNPEIWDRTNGRVYRVVYGDRKPESIDLGRATHAQLVEAHLHRNDWFVRMARKLLQERAADRTNKMDESIRSLTKMTREHSDATRRLRALWTLHAMNALPEEQMMRALEDADENVRAWIVQLDCEDRQVSPKMASRLAELAVQDTSALVRLYLASALQRLPHELRWQIADGLLRHAEDANDHNLPPLIWYGLEPLVAQDPERALRLAQDCQIPRVRQFILRRAATDERGLEFVVARLHASTQVADQAEILEQVLKSFAGRVGMRMPPSWQAAYESISKSDSRDLQHRADQVAILFGDQRVYPKMRRVVADRTADLAQRQQALELLVRGQDKQAAAAYHAALEEPALRGAAIRALTGLDDPQTPTLLIQQFASYSEPEQRDAIGTLTSRPAYARALLQAMEAKQIPTTHLHAYNVRQIQSFADNDLNDIVRRVWGEMRESSTSKREQIAKYRELGTASVQELARVGNGRRIFAATCANCHRLFGEGGDVGPDITGSNRANLDYVLENVVDPSAVLGKDYRMTVLELTDGRVISGLIKQETDSAITIRTLNDTLLIAKADIESRELSELSMMPEGLLDRLSADDVRDLIGYLASPTQVPLNGPSAPIDPQTGKVADALEGESLKIVDKSAGTAISQGMKGFPHDRWSGGDQLWWTSARDGDKLSLAFPVAHDGEFTLQVVLTRAPDYAVVRLSLDGVTLGDPIDLYASEVVTTGLLDLGRHKLTAGEHKLTIEISGANPHAIPARMVGIDLLRLIP